MKKIALAAATLMAASGPVVANAEQSLVSVDRAYCETTIVIHPDGSSDEYRHCHTTSDGTR